MNAIHGKITPIRDNILVHNMNFGETITTSGIIIQSDDGKVEGIRPRWAQVWAIGPEQKDVNIGDWVLIEHGRWTRKFVVNENNEEKTIHGIDINAILLISDKEPNER